MSVTVATPVLLRLSRWLAVTFSPSAIFGLYYCFWAQLVNTVCVAVLMQCSHVRSIVTSLPGPLWSSQFISVSINFPSISSPPLPFSPIPSPHSPMHPSSIPILSLPSQPPLPFRPFFPEHVPDPEVPCSVGCPNLHCWEQVAEEDCSG